MRKLFLGIAVLLVFGMMTASAIAGKGNNLPSGEHYNLNIIGVKNIGQVDNGSQGHTMFVPLYTDEDVGVDEFPEINEKKGIIIWMEQGDAFLVDDRDGTDGEATFIIGPGKYNVFARVLGKPGGFVEINSGGIFTDLTGTWFTWLGYVKLEGRKNPGKPVTVNINELFYIEVRICTLLDGDGNCIAWDVYEDVWVFDSMLEGILEDYLWKYNNQGTKLLQLRFYPCTIAETPEDPDSWPDDYCKWGDGTPIEPKKSEIILSDSGMYENVTIAWSGVRNDYF